MDRPRQLYLFLGSRVKNVQQCLMGEHFLLLSFLKGIFLFEPTHMRATLFVPQMQLMMMMIKISYYNVGGKNDNTPSLLKLSRQSVV
jgi:hypothetical protein